MKSLNYLFVAANEDNRWGGSELLWSQAAAKLAALGNRVTVSAKQWDAPVPEVENLRSAGCQIVYRRKLSFAGRAFKKVAPSSDTSDHLRSFHQDFDLVVISQGANTDGLAWMEAAREVGWPYAVVAQCAAERWWPEDDQIDKLTQSYDNARAAFFVSQGNVDLSTLEFASPIRSARVVRNPFNVSYDASPTWPPDMQNTLALACVARLDIAHKGQDLLFQVLSQPHWRERNVRVSLVGKGVNERSLRRLAQQMQLANVCFAGHLGNIEEVWTKHHALVLPSRYEGMPLALVEAMLCGRPVITTDVAGHRELVRDGINGFLAKAPTVELLDEAMNRAWDNRASLREMGEQAARDARKFVSADPAEDFVRELQSLVTGAESQMTAPSTVTVLITTYNYGQFIEQAIDSVLAQDYPAEKVQILVVDDGSTDDTAERVKKYGSRVDYFQKANGGQASALNFGFAKACGEIVALLDADDMFVPTKLSCVAQAFQADPKLGMVYHRTREWKAETDEYREYEFFPVSGDLHKEPEKFAYYIPQPTTCVCFRRSSVEPLLPIPENIRMNADCFIVALIPFLAPVLAMPEFFS